MSTASAASIAVTTQPRSDATPEDAARRDAYGLLGGLLSAPPTDAVLAGLAALPLPADAEGDFGDAWRVLKLAAQRAEVATADDEYHDLFIGLGRGEVMPYGSWYLTGFLMDRPLAVLRGDLAALGIERRGDVKEPEDHAAALCETMALLIGDGAALDLQRRFFHSHIGPWMKTLFRDVREARSAVFYRAVGRFGEEFIDFESRYLAMLV